MRTTAIFLLTYVKSSKRDEKKLHRMINRTQRNKIFELYDCIVIPINTGKHWCLVYIDVQKQMIYYYDPMNKGIQNVSAVKLITFYFGQFCELRSYCIDYGAKKFVTSFDITWESKFPLQKDHPNCGVFILMYTSYRLNILNVNPIIDRITEIRKQFVLELLDNYKKLPEILKSDRENRTCSIPTRFKQEVGKEVVLRCKVQGPRPKRFMWMHNGINVSTAQTFKFNLTINETGKYICHVEYNDGDIITSSKCEVECGLFEISNTNTYNILQCIKNRICKM